MRKRNGVRKSNDSRAIGKKVGTNASLLSIDDSTSCLKMMWRRNGFGWSSTSRCDWRDWLSLFLIAITFIHKFNPVNAQISNQVPPLETNALQNLQQQKVSDVSVMCAANAISGQFMFNTPFSGKIYSARYANVHDCVYYNNFGETMIMFSVPNYKCGTVVQRNSQNVISHIENEVYVQFDKETQNVEDRRFLFICDRAGDSSSSASSSSFPSPFNPNPQAVTYRGTIQPGQTIIVQTIEPTRVSATDTFPHSGGESGSNGGANGNTPQPYVWMEIQDGLGPGKPPVQRPLHLGDQVTLVVTGRSLSAGNQYDMFVHTCFASDGSGQNKIQLTDPSGCTLKSTVAGQMARQKNASEITYYLPLKAFKFPNSDDVYFSCAVEVCNTCNFPELCPSPYTTANNRTRRKTPSITLLRRYENDAESIQVHDYVKIVDNTDLQALRRDSTQGNTNTNTQNDIYLSGCFDRSVVIVLLTVMAALLTALICVSMYAMYLLRQRKQV